MQNLIKNFRWKEKETMKNYKIIKKSSCHIRDFDNK
jgi:hypothetical protein